MKIDVAAVRKSLKSFDFKTLFYEHLGWDKHQAHLDIPVDGNTVSLTAIAQKRGFVAFVCRSMLDRPTRLKIDHQVTKSVREHFVIYADEPSGQQVWHWVRREAGKPLASRDHRFDVSQSGDPLIQRLERIAVSMQEEEALTLPDIAGRNREAFDVDKVTKKFYERFKAEHAAFLKLIKGFPPPVKVDGKLEPHPDLQWYTSLMLNRLMFVYFIQKKGFLDGDTDYLRNRLAMVRKVDAASRRVETSRDGSSTFFTFYRYFLLRLFHDGLGKSPDERKLDPAMEKLLGKVPYLNGGFFEGHKLETDYSDIEIPDQAFEKLFNFFDLYSWHLDERPCRADNEINPDVVGYIFEKYINQKQMGAYYTKEDITEYIAKNTIIPHLFDAARKKCAIAFKPDGALWRLLQDDPDRYIYPAVGHGVTCDYDRINHRDHKRRAAPLPLPAEIEAGVQDVTKRDGWNKSAPEAYALPTETWREVVARRQRCLEIRARLRGEMVDEASRLVSSCTTSRDGSSTLCDINDLITLNLDIWQFARDAIVNAEGPELLRAFWQAIAGRIPEKSNEKIEPGITILDPTCGSGAFLFAALRILETLYGDCLARMERFIEDDKVDAASRRVPGATSRDGSSTIKYRDFRAVLAQIANHPNERYFILKSVIINNLFGVDIMEEAVEICKLRLFLKLVAQVETVDQIEPLPDIDFNIRAGNTLVGFASLDQVRKSQEGTLGFGKDQIARIEEEAEVVDRAFQQFRAQQVKHGGKVTTKEKKDLIARLAKLDAELDRYLAGEYGVNVAKQKEFDAWKASHQPFHWFVEFYGIMHTGGFDVIIGNPPYVEFTALTRYGIHDYVCRDAGNLYAVMIERAFALVSSAGQMGFIVPVSSISTERYEPLQKLLSNRRLHYCSFDDRPSRLFDGLEHIRLTIHLIAPNGESRDHFSTCYNKWTSEERPHLFSVLAYTKSQPALVVATMPKLSRRVEGGIIAKLLADHSQLSLFYAKSGLYSIFYSRKVGYFLQVLDFTPKVLDSKGTLRPPSEFKELRFGEKASAGVALACLNSNLFYWFMTVFSDCRHVNKREVDVMPVNLSRLASSPPGAHLARLAKTLMADIDSHSELRRMRFSHDCLTVQCIFPSLSKPIIDEIDRVLAKHYNFTDEELDFILNYDIKYRMGGAEDGEED